jgi:serine/threonine protein phosphatase PrpC
MSSSTVVLEIATRSDPGRVRPHNEDSMLASPDLGLVALADGMGGYNAGEVASSMATSLLGSGMAAAFAERRPGARGADGHSWARVALAREIGRVNAAIHEASGDQPQYSGMGTTLVAAVFHDDRVAVAHVGDSRLYRLRGGALELLTRDHSLLQEQIDAGIITSEQATESANRNLLTRALGVDPEVEADTQDHEARAGDFYLLCSDGLTDMLDDDRIAATVQESGGDLDGCVARLVDLANENGGRDNISAVLVKVVQTFPARRPWWARLREWFR